MIAGLRSAAPAAGPGPAQSVSATGTGLTPHSPRACPLRP
jgi:hypothetical protein